MFRYKKFLAMLISFQLIFCGPLAMAVSTVVVDEIESGYATGNGEVVYGFDYKIHKYSDGHYATEKNIYKIDPNSGYIVDHIRERRDIFSDGSSASGVSQGVQKFEVQNPIFINSEYQVGCYGGRNRCESVDSSSPSFIQTKHEFEALLNTTKERYHSKYSSQLEIQKENERHLNEIFSQMTPNFEAGPAGSDIPLGLLLFRPELGPTNYDIRTMQALGSFAQKNFEKSAILKKLHDAQMAKIEAAKRGQNLAIKKMQDHLEDLSNKYNRAYQAFDQALSISFSRAQENKAQYEKLKSLVPEQPGPPLTYVIESTPEATKAKAQLATRAYRNGEYTLAAEELATVFSVPVIPEEVRVLTKGIVDNNGIMKGSAIQVNTLVPVNRVADGFRFRRAANLLQAATMLTMSSFDTPEGQALTTAAAIYLHLSKAEELMGNLGASSDFMNGAADVAEFLAYMTAGASVAIKETADMITLAPKGSGSNLGSHLSDLNSANKILIGAIKNLAKTFWPSIKESAKETFSVVEEELRKQSSELADRALLEFIRIFVSDEAAKAIANADEASLQAINVAIREGINSSAQSAEKAMNALIDHTQKVLKNQIDVAEARINRFAEKLKADPLIAELRDSLSNYFYSQNRADTVQTKGAIIASWEGLTPETRRLYVDEIVKVHPELQEQAAQKLFNKSYSELSDEQRTSSEYAEAFSNEAGLHLVDSIVEDAQFFQIAGTTLAVQSASNLTSMLQAGASSLAKLASALASSASTATAVAGAQVALLLAGAYTVGYVIRGYIDETDKTGIVFPIEMNPNEYILLDPGQTGGYESVLYERYKNGDVAAGRELYDWQLSRLPALPAPLDSSDKEINDLYQMAKLGDQASYQNYLNILVNRPSVVDIGSGSWDVVEPVVKEPIQVEEAFDVVDGADASKSGPEAPTLPDFKDKTKPPEGFEWRGKPGSKPGSKEGNYHNPKTGESIRPDLDHPEPIGPHWDYKDPNGDWHRINPGGSMTPKK